MEKKQSVFSRLNYEHLQPLSLYSRMIICDPKASPHPSTGFTNPFVNFKIEIVNNAKKRKLEDANPEETCETPAKRLVTPKAFSPDQGCFVDFGSPLARQDSNTGTSQPAPLELKSEANENTAPQTIVPHFDNDIDSILCLSPSRTAAHNSNEEQVEKKDEGYFSLSYIKGNVSGPSSDVVSSAVEPLEGEDDNWNIGPPLFESSVCHSVAAEQVTEDGAQVEAADPVRECQTTLNGEETVDTSYEASLPLQVQVKSVVVALSSNKEAQPSQTEQNKKSEPERSQRPVVFERDEDWEQEKRLYVHSVTRHLNEKPAAGQEVMSELLNLMTHVVDQAQGSNGEQRQHPSDLTRRNYQRRFGNMMPKLSLQDWQAKNYTSHRRFAKVPKIFERSPFP